MIRVIVTTQQPGPVPVQLNARVRSSRNGTRSEGPSDSGRTLFFPGRNGPARPSAAGRSRPPGHSRPLLRAGWQPELSFPLEHNVYQLYAVVTLGHERSWLPSLSLREMPQGLCALQYLSEGESSLSRSYLSIQIQILLILNCIKKNYICLIIPRIQLRVMVLRARLAQRHPGLLSTTRKLLSSSSRLLKPWPTKVSPRTNLHSPFGHS